MQRHAFLITGAILLTAALSARAQDRAGEQFFESKIRPVLVEHCYSCHAADAKKLRGELYLDSKDGLRKGGESGPAIVPGKSKESLLVKALRYDNDIKMPPKGKLPEHVLADFAKWIDMGAPDPRTDTKPVVKSKKIEHDLNAGRKYWAFQPVKAPPVPKVKAAAQNPIDAFILAKLEPQKLALNPQTTREKLLRRVAYDLLGLPPAPEEMDTFAKDQAPDAYEKLLDRLLLSEHYGERWARHWLDIVRYAESGGYEFDGDRPGAHHYRDFVIKALNRDMPYNEFVKLQVAGDQLHPKDYFASSATGFLVAGPFPGQTTSKTAQLIRYNHLDDMLATLGSAMLGLTVGCARCHEHKYDPILQEDYYKLVACLGRTDSTNAKLDPSPEVYRKAKAEFDAAHAPLVAAREKFDKEQLVTKLQQWLQANKDKAAAPWLIFEMVDTKAKTTFKKLDDGSVLADGKSEKVDTYTIVANTRQTGITALRLEALADPVLPKAGPGRSPDGNFLLTEISVTAAPPPGKGNPTPVKLKPQQASIQPAGQTLDKTLDADKKSGWAGTGGLGKSQSAVFALEKPVGFPDGTTFTITLKFEGDGFAIGRPRLAFSTAAQPPALDAAAEKQHAQELRTVLSAVKDNNYLAQREPAVRWYRAFDKGTHDVYFAEEEHARIKLPQAKLVDVFSAQSGRGGDVRFLVRGEVERAQAVVKPGFMQVLMPDTSAEGRWLTPGDPKAKLPAAEPRIALASWLTDTEQGAGNLLARVIVNRLWQHHMGRGLVATPNDFGTQGEPPTHPELLDFLASELIRNGWKLKPIHKLIMTSAVYKQTGDVQPTAMQVDPQNKLWWRRPARRLEAEAIRDALLAVSGRLDKTMYGAGSVNAEVNRRSIYLTVKRSQMIPFMQMFDVPETIQSIGVRSVTTVPTQSLAFMNAPLVRDCAEKVAKRARANDKVSLSEALEQAYLLTMSRRPTQAESERLLAFMASQAQSYANPAQGLNAALVDACQILLCANEFVYVD